MKIRLRREGCVQRDGASVAEVVYVIDRKWQVTFWLDIDRKWDGPQGVDLQYLPMSDSTNGINTDILRSVPLADARMRLRNLRARFGLGEELGHLVIPERMATERDWAVFASAYSLAAARGKPLAALEGLTGTNRRTLASRTREVRKRGLLTAPTTDSLGQLTTKAKRLLEEGAQDAES